MRVELIGEDNTVLVSSPAPSVPDGYEVAKGEYRCMKDGELILVRHSDGWQWDDWDNCPKLMNPGHIATRKLKKIDMSRMKGQYCVYAHGIFIRHDTDDACTPIYGHTYAHVGGPCPVPEGFQCELTLRDGTRVSSISNKDVSGIPSIIWGWSGMDVAINPRDVIFIELIKVLEGYKL